MNNRRQKLTILFAATALLGAALTATRMQAEAETQSGVDRIVVTLDDPSRPCSVIASMVNGSITVKGYDGKEVIVEARAREREKERPESGPKRLNISTPGLSVESENNDVRVSTESWARCIDLTITVPAHASLKLRAVNDGDIVVTGVDGELDVDGDVLEESARAAVRLVDDLVRDDELAGAHVLVQRAHGGTGQYVCHAERLEGKEVGPRGHTRGVVDVALAVARQKSHLHPVERSQQNRPRGGPEGRVHTGGRAPERTERESQSAPTDDAEHRDWHAATLAGGRRRWERPKRRER